MNSLSHYQPICVRCQQNLRCQRNDVKVRLSENRIVAGDLYECPSCGFQIVTGLAEQFVDRFERPATFAVWDEGLGPDVRIGQPEMGEVFARLGDATHASDAPV